MLTLAFVVGDLSAASWAQTGDPAIGVETARGTPHDSASEPAPTKAQERELQADEDPQSASEADREVTRTEERIDRDAQPERRAALDLYGSLRFRYRNAGDGGDWQDGGSRAGVQGEWHYREGSFLFARYEAGFNLITGFADLNPGKKSSEEFEDSVFARLRYVGLDTHDTTVTAGKNWSAYYEVADFTDRFMGTGASASGAYNALTDGGPSGTGRADNVLKASLSTGFLPDSVFRPFNLVVQAQHGNPVPFGDGADYGTAIGLGAIFKTRRDLTVGVAYNQADIDLGTDSGLRDIGISGNARAAIVGIRGFGDDWYAGAVVSRLENHETTDQGIYFEGWGGELYAQYRVAGRWWLVGGFNVLEPDSDQRQAGEFRVRYAVAGLRYAFDDFRRMLFANVRLEDSMEQDGNPLANACTVGVRWDF